MTVTFADAPKFAIPVMFLGYAALANYSFVQDIGRDASEIPQSVADYFDGDAALKIDAYYKSIMPHRLPSIDLMGAFRYLTFREGRPGVVVGENGWLFSSEEFEAAGDRSSDLARAAKGIAEIRDALAARDIALVVVPLPAKADIYRVQLGHERVSDDLEALYADFRAALSDRAVVTIDTRPALLAARDRDIVFLQTDTHWSPYGAAAVANAVSLELGSMDAGATYRVAEAEPVEREGDLAKFIVNGALSRTLGLGPETVVPRQAFAIQQAAATDIFGAGAIPIALVGTSYSANAQWSFGESLKAELGSDVLNVAEEGLGPVAPMRKFLASTTLRDAPPRVVIWEFPIRYLADPDLWAQEPSTETSR